MLGISGVGFRTVFRPFIFRDMVALFHPVYALQGLGLLIVVVLAVQGLRKACSPEARLLAPTERKRRYMRYPEWARIASIASLAAALVPGLQRWPIWYYVRLQEEIILTERLFSDLLTPIYLGLLVLCVGLAQYYLLEFLIVGSGKRRNGMDSP